MPTPEPKDVALDALGKMRAARGEDALFSSDEIWGYATSDIPSTRRPGAIGWLHRAGHIERTGRMRHAATAARAGSMTPEYRFVRAGAPATLGLETMCSSFVADCEDLLRVSSSLLHRMAAALLSKRFLIITGLAGSGKTKLIQTFARWIVPARASGNAVNPHYAVVPVGADWTGNENVLGYPDGLRSPRLNADGTVAEPGVYITKPALDLILHAQDNPTVPHLLILDEMNLSHVERYFADFLSAMESEEGIPLHRDGDRRANGRAIPDDLEIPRNLFVVGTVNVDETTYMFSPKVLDRASVIEFRMTQAELKRFLSESAGRPDLATIDGRGVRFGEHLVAAAADGTCTTPAPALTTYQSEMLLFFNLLREHGSEFGYRTAYEAGRFLHFYKLLGSYPNDDAWLRGAMDCVIVQKFLPKLHGSRSKLEGLLWALAWACGMERSEREGKGFDEQLGEAGLAQDETRYSPDLVWSALAKINPNDPTMSAYYPISFDKVMRMWRRLVRDQFVSFAEA